MKLFHLGNSRHLLLICVLWILAFAWPLFPCVAFAFIDELRKTSISGRHCSIPEAWLNTAGCILGTILIGVILWALHWRK